MHQKAVFFTVGGLASITLVCAGLAWRAELGPLDLQEELAAARQEGIVVDPAQVREPIIPQAEDGTADFRQAASLANRVLDGTKWNLEFHPLAGPINRPIPVAAHPPAVRENLRAILAKQNDGIASLRRAGQRGRLSLRQDWARPFLNDYQELTGIRALTKTLVVRAELRRVESDLAGARDDIMTLARIAALYRDGSTLNQGLNRIGIEREALRAAHEYAAARPQDPASPSLLRDVVTTFGAPIDIRRLLGGEVLLSLGFIRARSAYESGMSRESTLRFGPVRDANLAYQTSYWRTVFRSLPRDPHDYNGARHALLAAHNAYRATTLRAIGLETHFREIDYLAQGEARRRIALATADVLERWQRNGKVPNALLAPPADPFGGPLHYLATPHGFIVYSFDRDGVDHRGKVSLDPRRSGDIAAQISLDGAAALQSGSGTKTKTKTKTRQPTNP